MGCLHYNRTHLSRRSLRTWWSLSTGVSRGSSISNRLSSTIRRSFSIRGSSSRISSSSRRSSIPIRISPSIRAVFYSNVDTFLFQGVITTFSWIFPCLFHGSSLDICASLGIFLFHNPCTFQ